MTYEQAERRLREIVNGSHGDQPLDILLKTDTEDFKAVANCILGEVKALKEDLETANKTLKKECKKNTELKSLLRAMMKYIVEEGDNDEDKL